jgi:hypothetical protein
MSQGKNFSSHFLEENRSYTNPFSFKRFIESFDALKYEIISWDWYYWSF